MSKVETTYNEVESHVESQLDTLAKLVKEHKPAKGLHYGHVGDLARVSNDLDNLIAFLSGEER